jgi:hypothetical protein
MSYNHISQLSAPQKTRKQHILNRKNKVLPVQPMDIAKVGSSRECVTYNEFEVRDLQLQYMTYIFIV